MKDSFYFWEKDSGIIRNNVDFTERASEILVGVYHQSMGNFPLGKKH